MKLTIYTYIINHAYDKYTFISRKYTQKGMIKGKNQKERLQTWYNHFQGLLGRPPEIEEDEPITQVLTHLEIKRGPFDINEYKRAKYTIKEGKICGMHLNSLMKYVQKF